MCRSPARQSSHGFLEWQRLWGPHIAAATPLMLLPCITHITSPCMLDLTKLPTFSYVFSPFLLKLNKYWMCTRYCTCNMTYEPFEHCKACTAASERSMPANSLLDDNMYDWQEVFAGERAVKQNGRSCTRSCLQLDTSGTVGCR